VHDDLRHNNKSRMKRAQLVALEEQAGKAHPLMGGLSAALSVMVDAWSTSPSMWCLLTAP